MELPAENVKSDDARAKLGRSDLYGELLEVLSAKLTVSGRGCA